MLCFSFSTCNLSLVEIWKKIKQIIFMSWKEKFLLDIRISKKGQIWRLVKRCLYYSFLKKPGVIHSRSSNLVLKNTSSSEKRYFMWHGSKTWVFSYLDLWLVLFSERLLLAPSVRWWIVPDSDEFAQRSLKPSQLLASSWASECINHVTREGLIMTFFLYQFWICPVCGKAVCRCVQDFPWEFR